MKISVIVPPFNSEKTIAKTLQSLLEQDYRDKEIIVVNDKGSRDRTHEITKGFKGVKVYLRPHGGPAEQRNFGARVAKGDIILFTDSDCVAPKDLLRRTADNFKKYDIAGCGGTYKTLNKESRTARFVGYDIAWRHEKASKWSDFLGTYCCAYKKDVFLKFGGFDEKFPIASGEDPEFSFRLAKAGHKLLLDKNMFVWHPHPNAARKYLKQQFWRAFWRVLMYRKHPEKIAGESYSGREPLYVTATITAFLFSFLSGLIFPVMFYVAAASLLLFFLTYSTLLYFILKKEPAMLLFAIPVIFLRAFYWLGGFGWGLLKSFR